MVLNTRVSDFVAEWNALRENANLPSVQLSTGHKYVRVLSGEAVLAFIDNDTGTVYRPASLVAPSLNYPRGNIENFAGDILDPVTMEIPMLKRGRPVGTKNAPKTVEVSAVEVPENVA